MCKFYSSLLLLFICSVYQYSAHAQDKTDDLGQYVERLKKSKANFGTPKLKDRYAADMPKPAPAKEQQQAKASPGLAVVKQPSTITPPVKKPQEAKPNPQTAARTTGSAPAKESKFGGTLLMGDYTCHQTVYNGARATPAFSFQYKGYFQLKKDGTYRWLDNGGSGRYSYDPKTGNIKWLSGHLANTKSQSSLYQLNTNSAQITINFTSDYRWECSCDKK